MSKLLRQLYDSEIRPAEESCPIDQEYLELQLQFDERNDLLLDMLNDRGQKLLEEIVELCIKIEKIKNVDEFVSGFKTGAKIILEILEDEQQSIS